MMPSFGPPEIGWLRLPDPSSAPPGLPETLAGVAQPIVFRDLKGYAVFEGCILVGKSREVRNSRNRASATPGFLTESRLLGLAIVGERYRWPAKNGAYEIAYSDDALDDATRATVRSAIQHWEGNTKLRFVKASGDGGSKLVFCPGPICASYVGRQAGPQDVLLAPGCSPGNVMHEIGHAAGLWHEHTRPDRDQHVKVVLSNVEPLARANFTTRNGDGMSLGEYDYGSIMHYPPEAFAVDSASPTLIARGGQPIGQRTGLSEGDKSALKALYP